MSHMDIDSETNKKEDYSSQENMLIDTSIENNEQLNMENFSPSQVKILQLKLIY